MSAVFLVSRQAPDNQTILDHLKHHICSQVFFSLKKPACCNTVFPLNEKKILVTEFEFGDAVTPLYFRCIKIGNLIQKWFHQTIHLFFKAFQATVYVILMVIVSIIVQWSPQNVPVSSLFCAKEHLVMMISIILPPRHSY